jgi:DNA-binding transcriptional MerR regulator
MRYFKTKEAAEIAGVERDRFVQWIFKGLIEPAVESPGRGRAAQFDTNNILSAKLIDVFYKVGFPLKKASAIAQMLAKSGMPRQTLSLENLNYEHDGRLMMTINVDAYRKDIEAEINRRMRKNK